MNRKALLVAATLVSCTGLAQAQDVPDAGLKAGTLRDACHPPASADPAARSSADRICQFYLRGVTDGLFMRDMMQQTGARLCLPTDGPVSPAEAKDELEDYLADHPEASDRSAGVVAAFAIVAAHPCE